MAPPFRIKKSFIKEYVPYCEEIADYICDLIATTTLSIRDLCEKYPELPHDTTIYRWRKNHPEFCEKYLFAKSCQAQIMAESINDIANEKYTYLDSEGNERFDTGAVAWQKLRIHTAQWTSARLAPRIYGDKQQNDTTLTVKHEDDLKNLS